MPHCKTCAFIPLLPSFQLALLPFFPCHQEVPSTDRVAVLVRRITHVPSTRLLIIVFLKRHYELAATLLTYALCLSNRSATLVASLGTYETSSAVSTADLKAHDETINTAAEMLCRSSGVLLHLAEVVLPRWEGAVPDGGRGRPVELTRDVVSALAKCVLTFLFPDRLYWFLSLLLR